MSRMALTLAALSTSVPISHTKREIRKIYVAEVTAG